MQRQRQGVPALPRPRRRHAGDEHHPRERPHRRRPAHASPSSAAASSGRRSRTCASTARRRWPARRSRRGMPVALGADWLPSGLDEPARRDEGRPPRARSTGPPDRGGRPRRHGHLGRRPARRARRAPRLRRRRAGRPTSSSSSGTTPTPTRTCASPTRRGSSSSASAGMSPTPGPTGSGSSAGARDRARRSRTSPRGASRCGSTPASRAAATSLRSRRCARLSRPPTPPWARSSPDGIRPRPPRRVPRERPNTIRTRPGPMLHLRAGV